MNKKQDYLSSLYQNSKNGMQSIHDILPKVENKTLKSILKEQYNDYEQTANQLEQLAKEKDLEIKDNNWFEKARMFLSVKMSTLFDDSTRNITTMFLIGSTMGLVKLIKDHSDYHGLDPDLDKIRSELEEKQQNNYNNLRDFLKKL